MNVANSRDISTYSSIPNRCTHFLYDYDVKNHFVKRDIQSNLYPSHLPEILDVLVSTVQFQTIFESSMLNKHQMKATSLIASSNASDNVEFVFNEYYDKWYDETKYLSSPKMFDNKHYRNIISLGSIVVPYIIEKLKKEPVHLFEALVEITSQDPVPKSHWGDIEQMALDWIDWWEEKQRAQT